MPVRRTLGIALTEHCNLRCPHCIRDDVTTVRSLAMPRILGAIDDALVDSEDGLSVSFTGGEPLLHPDFGALVAALRERKVAWRLTTNGWHYRRLAEHLDTWPAQLVRLSLSGATRESHDHDRGRGSFDRVLCALAVLTSRQVPAALSLVIDRRTRRELDAAYELATMLGASRLHYILPQPVAGSVARNSDLPPEEWWRVRDDVRELAARSTDTHVQLDYGYPFDGAESPCETLGGERWYVDARGRLSTCCQLSEYGHTETDVVGDLDEQPLRAWRGEMMRRRDDLVALQRKRHDPTDALDAFPCLRCARATGKLEWLRAFPGTPWHDAAFGPAKTTGASA